MNFKIISASDVIILREARRILKNLNMSQTEEYEAIQKITDEVEQRLNDQSRIRRMLDTVMILIWLAAAAAVCWIIFLH